jgi:hypothetical protein
MGYETTRLPGERPAAAVHKVPARSRVTNGRDILHGVDGRTATARRYRDLVANLISDAGGEDKISETRRQLIRRFSAQAVMAEQMEARLVMGEEIDLAQHCVVSSTLVRLASRLGINRSARLVPHLKDYLEAKVEPPAKPRGPVKDFVDHDAEAAP